MLFLWRPKNKKSLIEKKNRIYLRWFGKWYPHYNSVAELDEPDHH